MIAETVKKVAKELDLGLKSVKLGEPCFLSKDYRPKPFDIANFHNVDNNENHRKIAFVDGGNQLIVETSTLEIHLNKVYFNIFEGRRRLHFYDYIIGIAIFSPNCIISDHAYIYECSQGKEGFKKSL